LDVAPGGWKMGSHADQAPKDVLECTQSRD
jgi:hypothetical protein